jgi:hypothetical protein
LVSSSFARAARDLLQRAWMISLGTVALLEHPDQLAVLRSDREMLPGTVEELLRYLGLHRLPVAW